MNIAYLCNSFPEPSEWYVAKEIDELRRRSADVMACSVRSTAEDGRNPVPGLSLIPLRIAGCITATWLCIRKVGLIADLVRRVLIGSESVARRLRTVAHTWLGAYCAEELRAFHPDHIHVHHGYFAAWVAMVAARLLNIGFSMTLHGSDLLVRADYLDTKLQNCSFCFTVSEFNRRYILEHYPDVDSSKILVQHLGVDPEFWKRQSQRLPSHVFQLLSVGRLHPVKNHAFLLQACSRLKSAGVDCRCTIAGEGDERPKLERFIARLGLENHVTLLGQVSQGRLRELYSEADVVVLTSLSEGIPLTLMEAMAMECVVLAPSITGIPELVTDGRTGFLYQPRAMDDLLAHLLMIFDARCFLDNLRFDARQRILGKFEGHTNLRQFASKFMSHIEAARMVSVPTEERTHEDSVLQQIQLSVQRD